MRGPTTASLGGDRNVVRVVWAPFTGGLTRRVGRRLRCLPTRKGRRMMEWARNSKRSTPGRRLAALGADDAEGAAVDELGVDHRGPHVFVAEQRLNRPDVGARLEQVGREAVVEKMACRALGEPRRASCVVHGLLSRRFVQVVKDLSARRRIGARARGGEESLPREALGRVWHFCAEGMGQVDPTATSRKLLLVPLCYGIELGAQLLTRPSREQGRSIVLSFSAADHDLPSIEVDVLDADRERFEEAKAASIEELADEAKGRDEVPEQGEGGLPREDRGEVFGPAGAFERLEPGHFQVEDPFVEEEERAQRLFCVDAEVRRATASSFRKAVISSAPICRGCLPL